MIDRPQALERVRDLFRTHPGVAILGPRQCGKTTLARVIASAESTYTIFDLESPIDVRRLSAPMRNLGALSGLVVIDEIQRRPELFEILRVLIDRPEATTTRFLILGSASPSLVKGFRIPGRSGWLFGLGRIRSARNRCGEPGQTLAQRRIPTVLSGPRRRGLLRLASGFPAHPAGARYSATGYLDPR